MVAARAVKTVKRLGFCITFVVASLCQWNGLARAQDAYPSRPIRLIVSFTPGQGRSALLPDVPTLAEAGGDDDTLVPTYFALALPAGTPRPIAERLYEAMKRALAAPQIAERLGAAGLEPSGATGDSLHELVRRDIPRFRKIIQDIGIQPE